MVIADRTVCPASNGMRADANALVSLAGAISAAQNGIKSSSENCFPVLPFLKE
jgi:hypothetical protein